MLNTGKVLQHTHTHINKIYMGVEIKIGFRPETPLPPYWV